MANAGYMVALIVTVSVLAMLLGSAQLAASRIRKRRRGLYALARIVEEEPNLPFDEPTPAEMDDEEQLVREIFGEPRSRQRERQD